MSIRTLHEEARFGPVIVSLVEVVSDPDDGNRTEDYEVQCEACERYACTHLCHDEALDEAQEHATAIHGLLAIARDTDCPVCGWPETYAECTAETGPTCFGCRKCGWRQAVTA